MDYRSQIGMTTIRKEAWDKVTGNAQYTGDTHLNESLHARVLMPHPSVDLDMV